MSTSQLTRDKIIALTKRVGNLPAPPQTLAKVERELGKATASAARVAEAVQTDPALCLSILRMANSALHAPRNEITSVVHAINHLGLNEVRRVVLVAGLMGSWRTRAKADLQRFWTHSVAVGLTCAELARIVKLPPGLDEAAFAAGILHDLGALVLYGEFPEAAAEIQQIAEERACSLAEVELERWSIDHGEVGAQLGERWKLPIALREAMVHHHRPWLAPDSVRMLVQVVHIADFFCTNEGFARTTNSLPVWFDEGAWRDLGLQLADVTDMVERVGKQCSSSQVWVSTI